MQEKYSGELWKSVSFDFDYINNLKIEVSNYGRVKSISPSGERILKGSTMSGYPIVRLKFYKKRDEKDQKRMDFFHEQITLLVQQIKKLNLELSRKSNNATTSNELKKHINELNLLLDGLRKKYQKEYKQIELKRTINHGGLIHRMVADAFLEKESTNQIIVAHLNHNKFDNHFSNLKWMTREENSAHQKTSPRVIKAKESRFGKRFEDSKVFKLTSSKVMLIKKKINQGATLKTLAKSFKVSEMQISRIKRGECWGNVEAAR